jgi:hypothetical protein
MTTITKYQDENIIFSASNIVASFGDDDDTIPLDTVTHRSSVAGDELILSSASQKDKIVKLVTIPPEFDWRKNQSYVWKLDNGWMSNNEYGWIHWNSNSYIDSVIQIPSSSGNNTVLLICDTMEFHFTPILPTGFSHAYDQVIPSTKITLSNVQLGLLRDTTENNDKQFQYYHPCNHRTTTMSKSNRRDTCAIIDGTISSGIYGSTTYNTLSNSTLFFADDRPIWQLSILIAVVVFVVAFLVYILIRWCVHYERTKRYQEINPMNNCEDDEDADNEIFDLALKEEEEEE